VAQVGWKMAGDRYPHTNGRSSVVEHPIASAVTTASAPNPVRKSGAGLPRRTPASISIPVEAL